MSRFVEPIDEIHAECILARDRIRRDFDRARRLAAQWEPRPCPPLHK